MNKSLVVKGWAEFQHYRDRSPPWIKLHRGLLDNLDYFLLSPDAAKCLPLIWLIASESNGLLPETKKLAFRLRVTLEAADSIVSELAKNSFLISKDAEHDATPAQPKRCDWPSRHIPSSVKIAVWNRDCGKCVSCGSVEKVEYDHKTPVSKGGESTEENLQLLCRTCNRRKRQRTGGADWLSMRSTETETETETKIEKARAQRSPNGSRLPADWSPSEADIAFAKKERPDVSWQAEADKFRDYWHGVAGAKGRKADWPGTWRNWIRRADAQKTAAVVRSDTRPVKEALAPTESKEEQAAAWKRQMESYGVPIK